MSREDEIVALLRQGVRRHIVARRLGVSVGYVGMVARRAGLAARNQALREDRKAEIAARLAEGWTQKRIGAELGVTNGRIAQLMREFGLRAARRGGRVAAPPDAERIAELRAQGATWVDVGRALGVSPTKAWSDALRVGLPTARMAGAPAVVGRIGPERADELRALLARGWTLLRIGEAFGVSAAGVFKAAKRFGIPAANLRMRLRRAEKARILEGLKRGLTHRELAIGCSPNAIGLRIRNWGIDGGGDRP